MADAKQLAFAHRLSRIDEHHRKLEKGYVTRMTKDGLIIARPSRRSSRFPARGFFAGLALLMFFKVFVHTQIGAVAYDARVELLAEGTIVEQIGAFAMRADPITVWLSQQLALLI